MTIENGKLGSRERCRKAAISIKVRPPTKNIIIIGLGGLDCASDPPPVSAMSELPESTGREADDASKASRPTERSSSVLIRHISAHYTI